MEDAIVSQMTSIVTGVLASLVASIVFLLALRLLTPKILISSSVSVYPSDNGTGEDTYRVKIINQRYRSVSDLSVRFYVEHLVSVHGGTLKVRTPVGAKFTTHSLTRRRVNDKEFDNARRIRINASQLEKIMLEKRNSVLMVEIYCRDGVSGFGRVFTKTFSLGIDAFVRGSFEKGNTTVIRPYQGDVEFKLRKLLSENTGPTSIPA